MDTIRKLIQLSHDVDVADYLGTRVFLSGYRLQGASLCYYILDPLCKTGQIFYENNMADWACIRPRRCWYTLQPEEISTAGLESKGQQQFLYHNS